MGNVCVTESDSKVPNAPCVFPFKHKGVVYEGCPVDSSDKTRRWCSTKIDENGKHVNGNHGFCSKSCPVELVKGLLFLICQSCTLKNFKDSILNPSIQTSDFTPDSSLQMMYLW